MNIPAIAAKVITMARNAESVFLQSIFFILHCCLSINFVSLRILHKVLSFRQLCTAAWTVIFVLDIYIHFLKFSISKTQIAAKTASFIVFILLIRVFRDKFCSEARQAAVSFQIVICW